ncbi:hypothetical protein [Microvirga zambiensis]|uniref:hypothetical protein n=1 Tax=Microvirga zambiensis TaxID=1402137 RepID=UPI00191E360E|nr:hypothetical protein [Microvirga zambiensis]
MIQILLMFAIASSISIAFSRQNPGFDFRRRHGFAEHGFAKIDRVEDRLAVAFADGNE